MFGGGRGRGGGEEERGGGGRGRGRGGEGGGGRGGWWCIPDKAVFLLDSINLVRDITNADVAQLPILLQGKTLKWYTISIVHLMPWSLHVISSTQAFSDFIIASDRC